MSEYGVDIDSSKLVFDPQLGLDIQDQQGRLVNHPGILGLTQTELDTSDVITSGFESVNLASAGHIVKQSRDNWFMTPLLSTSSSAQRVSVADVSSVTEPQNFSRLLTQPSQQYTLGARFTGMQNSLFEANLRQRVDMLVFADVDMLTDRFWVQHSNFFGQQISTPFANNGDLVINSVDNLLGSSDLISIRSRGIYSRPFVKVSELEAIADEKFRAQELQLQQELDQVESELLQLQASGDAQIVTAEQEAAIETSIERRLAIRKALRQVRLQLERDIAALGNKLKLLNIVVFPLLFTLLLSILVRLFRIRPPRKLLTKAASDNVSVDS